MIFTIVGIILRLAELIFAAIVAGVLGSYLHDIDGSHIDDQGRFIYTEIVAGLAILFAIVWLLPFTHQFLHWPADIFVSVLWWIAFGLLVDYIGDGCGYIFDWDNLKVKKGGSTCQRWKTGMAFCFLSGLFWLMSAIVGFFALRRAARTHVQRTATRRNWYPRRSRV